jgi:hypothetical protein
MRVPLVVASERGHEEQQKDTTSRHERAGWGSVRNPSRPFRKSGSGRATREFTMPTHSSRSLPDERSLDAHERG